MSSIPGTDEGLRLRGGGIMCPHVSSTPRVAEIQPVLAYFIKAYYCLFFHQTLIKSIYYVLFFPEDLPSSRGDRQINK